MTSVKLQKSCFWRALLQEVLCPYTLFCLCQECKALTFFCPLHFSGLCLLQSQLRPNHIFIVAHTCNNLNEIKHIHFPVRTLSAMEQSRPTQMGLTWEDTKSLNNHIYMFFTIMVTSITSFYKRKGGNRKTKWLAQGYVSNMWHNSILNTGKLARKSMQLISPLDCLLLHCILQIPI